MKWIILLIGLLFARENPFKPVLHPTSIVKKTPHYFRKATFYLPKDARILKRVIFEYQSVNSDIKQKAFVINKDIDFHAPLILTHHPKDFSVIEEDFGIIKFFAKRNRIFIQTKDRLIRSFFLVKPFRLVLDFDRYVNFPTKKMEFDSFIKRIVIGSHGNFYRVVIYFDSNYKYKLTKELDGVRIELY